MNPENNLTRWLAKKCGDCPICKKARQDPESKTAEFVKKIESKFCPACRAYYAVHGRKAHEKK